MNHKFKPGDRVDFYFPIICCPTEGQGTPGTVNSLEELNGHPAYRVNWDDGFEEEPNLPFANIWYEEDLVLVTY